MSVRYGLFASAAEHNLTPHSHSLRLTGASWQAGPHATGTAGKPQSWSRSILTSGVEILIHTEMVKSKKLPPILWLCMCWGGSGEDRATLIAVTFRSERVH